MFTISLKVPTTDARDAILKVLNVFERLGSLGAGRTVVVSVEDDNKDIKPVKVYFDGDGSDKIIDIQVSGEDQDGATDDVSDVEARANSVITRYLKKASMESLSTGDLASYTHERTGENGQDAFQKNLLDTGDTLRAGDTTYVYNGCEGEGVECVHELHLVSAD